MIRSFRVAAAVVALSLASCGAPAAEDRTPREPPQTERAIKFSSGADVSVATFRDTTGCEWLIFRYRGVGVSTQPRTEIYGSTDARRQVCAPPSRQ